MKAYEIIEDPNSWTTNHISEDVDGNFVPWRSSEAVRFSLRGAIHRAYPNEDLHFVYDRMYAELEKSLEYYAKTWGHEACYEFLKRLNL